MNYDLFEMYYEIYENISDLISDICNVSTFELDTCNETDVHAVIYDELEIK